MTSPSSCPYSLERDADERVDLLAIDHVDRTSDARSRRVPVASAATSSRAGFVDVAHDHAGALGRGRQHTAAADALRAADDDDGLAVESSHVSG